MQEQQIVEDNVTLIEDFYGYYYDNNGYTHKVSRFTWTNINKIEVKVINYGARVISISYPDKNGVVDDIVLGFDDLSGYIFYNKYYFGATIGRMTNLVRNSTINIGKKHRHVKPNTPEHHQKNGGTIGFDQKIWDSHIEGKKVIMSYVSPDGEEGYPGSVMTQITFELSEKNEFKIDMESVSSLPTPINLSNLLYFNLAGHYAGPEHIYKHIVTLNCNCFTVQDDAGFSTGEVRNVVHTIYDFQIPKTLGKVIGITAKDGFYQNLCVNKGANQDVCFVARVLHPPSGRLIELYSNQYGVQIDTANSFGYGLIQSLEEITSGETMKSGKSGRSAVSGKSAISGKSAVSGKSVVSGKSTASGKTGPSNKSDKDNEEDFDSQLQLIEEIYNKLADELHDEKNTDYTELRDFIAMLRASTNKVTLPIEDSVVDFICDDLETLEKICQTPKQINYLKLIQQTIQDISDDDEYIWLTDIVDLIIQYSETLHSKGRSVALKDVGLDETHKVPPTPPPSIAAVSLQSKIKKTKLPNDIPSYYQAADRIIGKSRRLYTMHGGIALQTQNYPNCANIDHFPNCVLKPGDKYTHSITYKFWIRSGNPSRWIKRNQREMTQMQKDTA